MMQILRFNFVPIALAPLSRGAASRSTGLSVDVAMRRQPFRKSSEASPQTNETCCSAKVAMRRCRFRNGTAGTAGLLDTAPERMPPCAR